MWIDAVGPDQHDSPTTELSTAGLPERCANCRTPLASDQRYCLNCGQRRGKARFSPDALAAQTGSPVTQASAPPPHSRGRISAGATLVAGIATLLIAMGVGVLIGHYSGSSTPVRASAPPVITVNGGSSAGTASTAGAAGSAAAPVKHAKATKAKAPKVVHITAKQNKAAAAAVSKVLGSGGNFSSNPTVQQGQTCSGGAGCQSGKFTGNFFGQ